MSSSPSLRRCVLRATRALMLTTGLVVSMASVAAADGNRDQAVQQQKPRRHASTRSSRQRRGLLTFPWVGERGFIVEELGTGR